jgi:hypothetical protein
VRNNLPTDEIPCIAFADGAEQGAVHEATPVLRFAEYLAFSLCALLIGLVFLAAPLPAMRQKPTPRLSAFNSYMAVETRLARQHRSQKGFLAPGFGLRKARCACAGAS